MGSREIKIIAVLSAGFGLVGIDRFLISTMYPVIAKDLNLGYGDIGTISGALAIAWSLSSLFMGNISDRIGRRVVLIGSLVVFSLLIGASGLATGLAGLVLVRVLMGFADGAYMPASISAVFEASPPERHGRNIGIQQMVAAVSGLALAPLLVGLLLPVIDWRWIFSLFVIPGFIVAWLIRRTLPSAPRPTAAELPNSTGRGMWQDMLQGWRVVLRYSNIRILTVAMLCWLTVLITTNTLLPSYFLDHVKLNFAQMGTVMSASGFGAAFGQLLLPWLSDRTGRKPVMVMGALGATLSLILLAFSPSTTVVTLFVYVFAVNFFNTALITMTVGPVCAETVPPALMATASGLVIAVGEMFGGGVAPIIAGQVAERFGIAHVLWMPLTAIAIGLVLSLFLKETKPAASKIILAKPESAG